VGELRQVGLDRSDDEVAEIVSASLSWLSNGFSDRARLSTAGCLVLWARAGIVSVRVTLLYAVGPDGLSGAARIGQTERRAILMGAL